MVFFFQKDPQIHFRYPIDAHGTRENRLRGLGPRVSGFDSQTSNSWLAEVDIWFCGVWISRILENWYAK